MLVLYVRRVRKEAFMYQMHPASHGRSHLLIDCRILLKSSGTYQSAANTARSTATILGPPKLPVPPEKSGAVRTQHCSETMAGDVQLCLIAMMALQTTSPNFQKQQRPETTAAGRLYRPWGSSKDLNVLLHNGGNSHAATFHRPGLPRCPPSQSRRSKGDRRPRVFKRPCVSQACKDRMALPSLPGPFMSTFCLPSWISRWHFWCTCRRYPQHTHATSLPSWQVSQKERRRSSTDACDSAWTSRKLATSAGPCMKTLQICTFE